MTTVAAQWNHKMDVILDAVDRCRDDERVTRRSCLDLALKKNGLMVHTREMIAALMERCRFFEPGPLKGWLDKVFPEHPRDVEERAIRFVEEALELAQVEGVSAHQMHGLVDQVFGKAPGERMQELGGVMVTLAAYCAVAGVDAGKAFDAEYARCNDPEVIVKIQRKHAQKAVVSSRLR